MTFLEQVKIAKSWNEVKFDAWVPKDVRNQIREFWSEFDRKPIDWLKDSQIRKETPPYGKRVKAKITDRLEGRKLIKKIVKGRFIHAWNNIGRIICEDCGTVFCCADHDIIVNR